MIKLQNILNEAIDKSEAKKRFKNIQKKADIVDKKYRELMNSVEDYHDEVWNQLDQRKIFSEEELDKLDDLKRELRGNLLYSLRSDVGKMIDLAKQYLKKVVIK